MKGTFLLIACLLAMMLMVTFTEGKPVAKRHEEAEADPKPDTKDDESEDSDDEKDSEEESEAESSGSGSGNGKYLIISVQRINLS